MTWQHVFKTYRTGPGRAWQRDLPLKGVPGHGLIPQVIHNRLMTPQPTGSSDENPSAQPVVLCHPLHNHSFIDGLHHDSTNDRQSGSPLSAGGTARHRRHLPPAHRHQGHRRTDACRSADARIIYVGETHDNPAAHRLELQILKAVAERYPGADQPRPGDVQYQPAGGPRPMGFRELERKGVPQEIRLVRQLAHGLRLLP